MKEEDETIEKSGRDISAHFGLKCVHILCRGQRRRHIIPDPSLLTSNGGAIAGGPSDPSLFSPTTFPESPLPPFLSVQRGLSLSLPPKDEKGGGWKEEERGGRRRNTPHLTLSLLPVARKVQRGGGRRRDLPHDRSRVQSPESSRLQHL